MKIVTSSLNWGFALVLGVCGQFLAGCADAQGPAEVPSTARKWTVTLTDEVWRITGDIRGPANISAIASVDGKGFLIGSDDLIIAQYGSINRSDKTLEVQGLVTLVGKNDDDEIDIEGIAANPDGREYYVSGSHSLTKKGNMNKERRSVFRVGVDSSGRPKDKVKDESLKPVIERDPSLKEFWEQPQQLGGINIEGLAYRNGSLFAGLRSPNIDDHALVLQVSARALFRKGKEAHKLHRLPLGDGLGIREMVSIKEGFLVVAGNAGDEPTRQYPVPRDYRKNRGYKLFFWDVDRETAELLTPLPRSAGRPEAMLVLADTAESTELLILLDGVPGGSPMHFIISKS